MLSEGLQEPTMDSQTSAMAQPGHASEAAVLSTASPLPSRDGGKAGPPHCSRGMDVTGSQSGL